MFIARARAIRATAAATAALLVVGLGSPASAEQVRRLTNTNATAASTASAQFQPTNAVPADRRICVRGQRVMSRITQDVCRSESEWERRGGFLPVDRH